VKTIFLLIIVLASFNASAEDVVINVCGLQSHSNMNGAYLKPCEKWVTKNGCQDGSWVAWNMGEFQGNAMYSTALTALVSGLNVAIRIDGASCHGRYDEITMVRILK
jgi:hypothetical protein